ncbi:GAF domain-containing protein [Dictyobacter arantiisoli]|nr:GAF domain-containing protein [Dictyobacter arantiisoli]
MNEDLTWRVFLGTLIVDPHERQRIADAIGINPVTLIRWTTNKSNPRPDSLRRLVEVLPLQREALKALIIKEYPNAFHTLQQKEELIDVSATFYAHVLNSYTSNPSHVRTRNICALILQQILKHLDPHEKGMITLVAQCMPPREGRYVRSLRQTIGRGTHVLGGNLIENHTQFFGAESQAGHALNTLHPIVIQSRAEKERLFPLHAWEVEESSVAYPILLADQTVGVFCLASTQARLFTQAHLDILQKYVYLLTLAFDAAQFFALSDLALGVMPPRPQQLSFITQFKQRMIHMQLMHEHSPLPHAQAELLIWQDLEEELLCLPPS